jgi:protein-disulfide isomerase
LSEAAVLATAKQAGLDVAKMQTRMPDKAVESVISNNLKLARSMGIGGTPTFVIGDRIIEGAIDTAGLKQAIAEARSGCMTC